MTCNGHLIHGGENDERPAAWRLRQEEAWDYAAKDYVAVVICDGCRDHFRNIHPANDFIPLGKKGITR